MTRSCRRGFTLFELLLVLALIGLFSSLFVLNIGSMLRGGELDSLEHAYWRAVDSARTGAVFKQQTHYIEWDEKGRRFLVNSPGATAAFEVDMADREGMLVEVKFEESAAENSYVLIAGKLLAKRPIAKAGFFPDGTCSPYSVSLKIGEFESLFQMDPWTGVQMVEPQGDESRI